MTTTGPNMAGAGANDASNGSAAAWANPTRITASDASYATVTVTRSGSWESQYIKGSNFGFSIPATDVITGIEGRYYLGGTQNVGSRWPRFWLYTYIQSNWYLYGETGDVSNIGVLYFSGGDGSYAGAGGPILYSDVNDSTFGIGLTARIDHGWDGDSVTGHCDYIQATIYHITPKILEDGSIHYIKKSTTKYAQNISIITATEQDNTFLNSAIIFLQDVSGSMGNIVGTLNNITIKSFTGAINSLSGMLSIITNKALIGISGVFSGELNRLTSRTIDGVVGVLTGSVAAAFIYAIALTGYVGALSGALFRSTLNSLSGSISSVSGSLSRLTSITISGASGAFTGALSSVRTFTVSLAGAIQTLSGNLNRVTQKSISGAASAFTGSLARQTNKAMTGTVGALSATLSTLKYKAVSLAGSITLSGSLVTEAIKAARARLRAGSTTFTTIASGTISSSAIIRAGRAAISKIKGGRPNVD